MNNTDRYTHIDFLRAFTTIIVIATHVYSYSLTTSINSFIWNYLHFVVPAFVFCSGFVMMDRYKNKFTSLKSTLIWYKKRLVRLLLPFYLYLFAHYALFSLFPNFFSGLGLQKSSVFLFNSVLLTGGINHNWLPLLFIEMAIIFPLFIYMFKSRLIKYYLIFAILITILFTVQTIPYGYYRSIMWIPWSLILLSSMYLSEIKNKKAANIKVFKIITVSVLIFVFLFIIWHPLQKSFNLIDYKYPPSLYYLSYATALTFIFLFISQLKLWQNKKMKNIYTYISRKSYSLYFVHFIVIDFALNFRNKLFLLKNTFSFFLTVLIVSILIVFLIGKLKSLKLSFLPKS